MDLARVFPEVGKQSNIVRLITDYVPRCNEVHWTTKVYGFNIGLKGLVANDFWLAVLLGGLEVDKISEQHKQPSGHIPT